MREVAREAVDRGGRGGSCRTAEELLKLVLAGRRGGGLVALGPTMRHKVFSSRELRRTVMSVWLEALIKKATAATAPDVDALACLQRCALPPRVIHWQKH